MSASEDEYDPTAEERAEVEAPPPPPPPRGIPVLDDDMYDPLDAGERASSEEDDAGYCFDDGEAEAPEEPEEEPEDPEAAAAKAKAVSIMKQRDKTLSLKAKEAEHGVIFRDGRSCAGDGFERGRCRGRRVVFLRTDGASIA